MESKHPSTRRYPAELKERAVRLVEQTRAEGGDEVGVIARVARQLGVGDQSLRNWIRQAEIDSGRRQGLSTDERARLRALEKENRELRRANEILKSGGCRTNGSARGGQFGRRCVKRGAGAALASAFYVRCQSLSRLRVVQMSFHSLAAAGSPRRDSVRICLLCLIWPKIGSMVAARFL